MAAPVRRSSGFTLIELMIAVAVIAILAGIAIPSYQDSVRRSRRTDAISALTQVQLAQEKLRANCAYYASKFDSAGKCASDSANTGVSVLTSTASDTTESTEGYYTIKLLNVTSTGYTVTATPKANGPQAKDTCQTFTLNQNGPVASDTSSKVCWKKG